jgi:hypothetical protein
MPQITKPNRPLLITGNDKTRRRSAGGFFSLNQASAKPRICLNLRLPCMYVK